MYAFIFLAMFFNLQRTTFPLVDLLEKVPNFRKDKKFYGNDPYLPRR